MIELQFTAPTPENYQKLLKRCPKSTLLQSYPYAYAIRQIEKLEARLGIITKHGKQIGFFNTHEAKTLFGLFHVMTIDRGPCWFKGHDTQENLECFAHALNKIAPPRLGRMRRFMPETDTAMQLKGWKKRDKAKPYQTLWLDLQQDEQMLLKKLKKNWRAELKRAEKKSLRINDHIETDTISWFLKEYLKDRMAKQYAGAGLRFSAHLLSKADELNDLIILQAIEHKKVIAAIAIIKHGRSATYQIGWTTTAGRAASAHHYLLWQAIKTLKAQGICYLDLGGINPDTATGVTQFKRNMGADETTLIGQFG